MTELPPKTEPTSETTVRTFPAELVVLGFLLLIAFDVLIYWQGMARRKDLTDQLDVATLLKQNAVLEYRIRLEEDKVRDLERRLYQ